MPHIIVRGIDVQQICKISTSLLRELAEICDCETDNFMIECLQTTSVFDGKIVNSFPFVEIAWFDRGLETRNRFAKAITEHIHSEGISDVEIAFIEYEKDKYYINGMPCK